jgi:hypothetical protein
MCVCRGCLFGQIDEKHVTLCRDRTSLCEIISKHSPDHEGRYSLSSERTTTRTASKLPNTTVFTGFSESKMTRNILTRDHVAFQIFGPTVGPPANVTDVSIARLHDSLSHIAHSTLPKHLFKESRWVTKVALHPERTPCEVTVDLSGPWRESCEKPGS